MKNRDYIKIIHVVLAFGVIFLFLFAPFASFGGKYDITGIEMLKNMGSKDSWAVLFIALPLLAALSNLSDSTTFRGLASISLIIPIVLWLADTSDQRGIELAPGGIIYIIGAIVLTVLGFTATTENSAEEPSAEPTPSTPTDTDPAAKQSQDSDPSAASSAPEASDHARYMPPSSDDLRRKQDLRKSLRNKLEQRKKEKVQAIQPETLENAKLREIIGNPQLYVPEVVRACTAELDKRLQAWQEQNQQEFEQARLARKQQDEAERQRRNAARAQRRPMIIKLSLIGIAILILGALLLYLSSDRHKYNRIKSRIQEGDIERAETILQKIDNTSKYYTPAYYTAYQYYVIQADTVHAAKALGKIARSKAVDWEKDQEAYTQCVFHFTTGDLAPYLPSDGVAAADLLNQHYDPEQRLRAGILYFNNALYHQAKDVFTQRDLLYDPTAHGYLGIMHLYGLGSCEQDAEAAWNYLKDAPDQHPFVLLKGDLALFARNKDHDPGGRYMAIEEAHKYYTIANTSVELHGSPAVTIRLDITTNLLNAHSRHEKRARQLWHDDRWTYYSFRPGEAGAGSYDGEVVVSGNTTYPHGWGCFTWENGQDIWLGRFNYLKNQQIIQLADVDNDGKKMLFRAGQWANDKLNGEGIYISSSGETQIGRFKNSELQKGEIYGPSGKLIGTR